MSATANTGRPAMPCTYYNKISKDNTTRYVQWMLFYPRCGRLNLQCNPLNGAYVSAITICEQNLWSWANTVEDA
jgi:hypothetical protein